jgi:hypothetical protein
MRATEPEWAGLQRWLLRQIVGDGAPREEDAAAAEPGLHDVIRGSTLLPPQQRLAIYARSYVLRLIECLHEEFPALRLLVGDQVFDLFAGAYIADRPPRCYSLYELGAGFADFLEATRPADSAGPGSLEAIPASLARLERAISEAQRAVGIETLRDAALPVDALLPLSPELRLRLPDTVRLLHLDFDFAATLAAARQGERPGQPPARDTFVAVARSHYRVRVHAVTPSRFAWLRALGYRGVAMRDAVATAARLSSQDAGAILADLLTWLPSAAAAGLVARSFDL